MTPGKCRQHTARFSQAISNCVRLIHLWGWVSLCCFSSPSARSVPPQRPPPSAISPLIFAASRRRAGPRPSPGAVRSIAALELRDSESANREEVGGPPGPAPTGLGPTRGRERIRVDLSQWDAAAQWQPIIDAYEAGSDGRRPAVTTLLREWQPSQGPNPGRRLSSDARMPAAQRSWVKQGSDGPWQEPKGWPRGPLAGRCFQARPSLCRGRMPAYGVPDSDSAFK